MTHEEITYTQVELLNLLHYNPDTGFLLWKERSGLTGKARAWNTRYAGNIAGAKSGNRVNVTIRQNGKVKHYRAHNIIWFMVTGRQVPSGYLIDHEDGDGTNNTWLNLRLATHSQNAMNRGVQSNNKSGHSGIRWDATRGKWKVEIKTGRKCKHLGRFNTYEEALHVRMQAEQEIFGDFRRK